jgi:hypothetical protein
VPAQSTWKKSQASIVAACARRNCRQVAWSALVGAGGIRRFFRTRRIVEAPTPAPHFQKLALDPLVAQVGFCLASWPISSAMSGSIVGRPVRWG